MLPHCLYVMAGGALGALMRYGLSRLLAGITILSVPMGTISANLLGCFILGMLNGIGQHYSHWLPAPLMLMLTVGMCGAFTTFSTFTAETVKMMDNGQLVPALGYVAVSVLAGLLLFWAGRQLFA